MAEVTIFHKIISGEVPCYKVWEDTDHLAFLSIFPNTVGVTVVIPKNYEPSYFADAPDAALSALILAAKTVAKLLDEKLPDVGRVALVFEGFGVNYLHAKLFPMHGTDNPDWRPIKSSDHEEIIYDKYPGYISSHDAKLEDSDYLSNLAAYLRGEVNEYPVRA
ncbi:MAG: HIT family protein [Candidatus Falkowbacteria bacterium]